MDPDVDNMESPEEEVDPSIDNMDIELGEKHDDWLHLTMPTKVPEELVKDQR